MAELYREECRESQCTVTQLTARIHELQDNIDSMNDSRDFQDAESVCSSRLSYVPMQPRTVSSNCGMLSRDESQRPNTQILLDISGDVFGSSAASMESTTLLHGRRPVSPVHGSVFKTAGNPVTQEKRDDFVKNTISTSRFSRRSSTRNSPSCAERVYPQN